MKYASYATTKPEISQNYVLAVQLTNVLGNLSNEKLFVGYKCIFRGFISSWVASEISLPWWASSEGKIIWSEIQPINVKMFTVHGNLWIFRQVFYQWVLSFYSSFFIFDFNLQPNHFCQILYLKLPRENFLVILSIPDSVWTYCCSSFVPETNQKQFKHRLQ